MLEVKDQNDRIVTRLLDTPNISMQKIYTMLDYPDDENETRRKRMALIQQSEPCYEEESFHSHGPVGRPDTSEFNAPSDADSVHSDREANGKSFTRNLDDPQSTSEDLEHNYREIERLSNIFGLNFAVPDIEPKLEVKPQPPPKKIAAKTKDLNDKFNKNRK